MQSYPGCGAFGVLVRRDGPPNGYVHLAHLTSAGMGFLGGCNGGIKAALAAKGW